MIRPINEYFAEVEAGNLAFQRKDGLILFDYNKTCTYNKNWNAVTLNARGIVFEEATGKLVANPIPKFFNLTEPLCQLQDLPNEPFLVLEKADGSCGICYFYNGEWRINTRGSFNSDQAQWAKKWFDANVQTVNMNRDCTYVFEIIYPSNKIVIDYSGKEMLVLLSVRVTETGREFPYGELVSAAYNMQVEKIPAYHYSSLEELFTAQKKLTANEEGFVVWYQKTNFRFKLKGEEYCKIHSMLSNLTPLAFWRAIDMETLKIPVSYLAELPEEFAKTISSLKEIIESLHSEYFEKIKVMAESVPKIENKYELYLYCQNNFGELGSTVLFYINDKMFKVKNFIHNEVRPKANQIPGVDLTRIERILDNDG